MEELLLAPFPCRFLAQLKHQPKLPTRNLVPLTDNSPDLLHNQALLRVELVYSPAASFLEGSSSGPERGKEAAEVVVLFTL